MLFHLEDALLDTARLWVTLDAIGIDDDCDDVTRPRLEAWIRLCRVDHLCRVGGHREVSVSITNQQPDRGLHVLKKLEWSVVPDAWTL